MYLILSFIQYKLPIRENITPRGDGNRFIVVMLVEWTVNAV